MSVVAALLTLGGIGPTFVLTSWLTIAVSAVGFAFLVAVLSYTVYTTFYQLSESSVPKLVRD